MSKEFWVGRLKVCLYDTRAQLGAETAKAAAKLIRDTYGAKGEANIIFASSPSQLDVLNALLKEDVDWSRVNAFHMDEYIGLSIEHKASFANYLRENFFSKIRLKGTFYLNGMAEDVDAECRRYADLLMRYPTDITFAGVGENGHLAFNDPRIADFFEKPLVKVNGSLDAVCRQQQINDDWFEKLEDVPDSAITVTFPGLLRATHVLATVPGSSKSDIVAKSLQGPIGVEVPASILRLHADARMSIDAESAVGLTQS